MYLIESITFSFSKVNTENDDIVNIFSKILYNFIKSDQ